MINPEQAQTPTSQGPGKPCSHCGAPLPADQRYCLNCGTRQGEPRVAYADHVANGSVQPPLQAPPAQQPRSTDISPLVAVLGIALLGGMLLIGVLLGRGQDEQVASPALAEQTTSAATPESDPADGSTAPPPTDGEVISEWPTGTEGFTVELGTLDKGGTTADDVEATRADLESSGAADVGVLDSDLYPSLPSGDYVFYTGMFDTREDAEGELGGLGSEIEGPIVIEITTGTDSGGFGALPDAGSATGGGSGGTGLEQLK